MQEQPQQQILGGEINSTNATTPFEEPVYVIGNPSEAAKVIGILIMVFGGFTTIGGLLNALGGGFVNDFLNNIDSDAELWLTPTWVYVVQGIISFIAGLGYVYSGWLTQNYDRRGIYFTWAILVITTILGIILAVAMPYPEIEGGMTSGRMKMIGAGSAACGGIFSVGFCGVLAAIPLFMNNHGMK